MVEMDSKLLWANFLFQGSILFGLLLNYVISSGGVGVGIVFSPYVRDEDKSDSTSYTTQDIQVMLELIASKGFREIATYGVGAPDEFYIPNSTWKRASSIVYTAPVAAEMNLNKSKNILSLYQGIFVGDGYTDQETNTEIQIGFEMAAKANDIYNNTVAAIVLPAMTAFVHLLQPKILNLIANSSKQCRPTGMRYGTRIWDCATTLPNVDRNNLEVLELFANLDFIICLTTPNFNLFSNGPEHYNRTLLRDFSQVISAVNVLNPDVEVILEVGWPGGLHLNEQDSIGSMLKFWDMMKQWAEQNHRRVFMHEAFDNPWKAEITTTYWGAHYGLWSYNQDRTGPLTVDNFILKVEEKDETPYDLIIGVVFGLILFVVMMGIIVVLYQRLMTRVTCSNKLSKEELRHFLYGNTDHSINNYAYDICKDQNAWNNVPYNRDFELSKSNFIIDHAALIGVGQFGTVCKGRIVGIINEVAFKTTRPDCPLSALRGLLSEIKILIYMGKHENVVSICGAYTAELANGNVYVAMELCENGSLERYLRVNKSSFVDTEPIRYVPIPISTGGGFITESTLLRWSMEVASAMEFISSKNLIHVDLAARNVLLTATLTAKVTDFGLSRRLYEYTEYIKKNEEPMPWRWMAVESLKSLQFSTKSDVWSFGVVLWEIFSLGDNPYPGLSWDVNFINHLENGLIMGCPSRASADIYNVMVDCWQLEPQKRPNFDVLKKILCAKLNLHQLDYYSVGHPLNDVTSI